jgi:hypothetical protein
VRRDRYRVQPVVGKSRIVERDQRHAETRAPRRALLALSLAVFLLGAVVHPSHATAARGAAAHPATASLAYAYGVAPSVSDPVEQETDWPFPADPAQWVISPYRQMPCSWDTDDLWTQHAQGTLAAGESLTVDECMIASPTMTYRTVNGTTGWYSFGTPFLGTLLRAPMSTLEVRLCYSPQDRCFTPAPVYDPATGGYLYTSCSHTQYAPDDPALVVIPGSQGGVGLAQTVTVTVRNPTARNARNFYSDVSMGPSRDVPGCAGSTLTDDYPFRFAVS